MYRYLSIRFDSTYSLSVKTDKVIEFIRTLSELKQKDKSQFENQENLPWGVVSLLKCDDRGCYSLDKGEYFERINLIELIFSDTDESFKHYFELGSKISAKMKWEMFDEENDEIIL